MSGSGMEASQGRVELAANERVRDSGRGAAIVLAVGGIGVFVGSFMQWAMVGFFPGLFFEIPEPISGIDAGPGVLTAYLGLLLVLVGVDAYRRAGSSPFRTEAIALAMLALLVVVIHVLRTDVRSWGAIEPAFGPALVAIAAVVSAIASRRLRVPDVRTRAWALERRSAVALIVAGSIGWSLAETGNLDLRAEPITYGLVLVALGIGQWPGRLAVTRFLPSTLGLAVILYGAAALGGLAFGGLGLLLFEVAPLGLCLLVAATAILEIPPDTEGLDALGDEVPADVAMFGVTPGLVVAALGLTGAVVFLLLVRLLDLSHTPFWVAVVAESSTTAEAWSMLVAGLAIAAGLVITLVRTVPRRRTVSV